MMRQEIHGGKGWQAEVNAGGIAYLAENINIYQPPLKHSSTGIFHNLPRSGVPQFVGRESDLEQIYRQLQQTNSGTILALSGMGGIGKTEMALRYALKHLELQTYLGGIFWLRAGEEIGTQVVSLAQTCLEIELPENIDLDAQVAYCWRNWIEGNVLVVLDDVKDYQDIRRFLPPPESRFKVLLTTRLTMSSPIQNFEIKVLTETAAITLLNSLVIDGRIQEQVENTKELCEWMGYLPLGLELVGRYLFRRLDLSIVDMLQRLKDKSLESIALRDVELGMTATLGVAAAFELSWDILSEPEKQMGYVLSLFALAPVPWVLAEKVLPEQSSESLENIQNCFMNLHLIQRETAQVYSLHQLIKQFFQEKFKQFTKVDINSCKLWAERVVRVVDEAFPSQVNQENWMIYRSLLPHANSAIQLVEEWQFDFLEAGYVLKNTAFYLTKYSQYIDAELAYEQAMKIFDKVGSKYPDRAACLIDLSELYDEKSNYFESGLCIEEALKILEEEFSSEHAEIAKILAKLALSYEDQGRYREAEPIFKRAWKILENNDVVYLAEVFNNLGKLYLSTSRYSESEQLLGKALEIRKRELGDKNLGVADTLNNLALLYTNQGQNTKKVKLFLDQALLIQEELLGTDSPRRAISLQNLGDLYRIQRHYADAEKLYKEALDIWEKTCGLEHRVAALCLNSLGLLYVKQNQYLKAENFHLQALEILNRVLDPNHPNIAVVLTNLAFCFQRQRKNYVEAESLYQQAKIIWEEILPNHPDSFSCLYNLMELYYLQNNFFGVEAICKQIVEAYRKGDLVQQSLLFSCVWVYWKGRIKYFLTKLIRRESI